MPDPPVKELRNRVVQVRRLGDSDGLLRRVLMGRRFGFTAAMVVLSALGNARHDQLAVIVLAHAGKFLEKGDGAPKLLVRMVAPGGHTGHLDAVLHNPEQLAWC